MGVNTSISGSSSQILSLTEWDVFTIRVFVAFSETEIDDVDVVFVGVVTADQEVVWLDVSVNYSLFMDFLNSLNLYLTTNFYHRPLTI